MKATTAAMATASATTTVVAEVVPSAGSIERSSMMVSGAGSGPLAMMRARFAAPSASKSPERRPTPSVMAPFMREVEITWPSSRMAMVRPLFSRVKAASRSAASAFSTNSMKGSSLAAGWAEATSIAVKRSSCRTR